MCLPFRKNAQPCNIRHGMATACGEDGGDLEANDLEDLAGLLMTSSVLSPLTRPPSAAPVSPGCSGGHSTCAEGHEGTTGKRSTLLQ